MLRVFLISLLLILSRVNWPKDKQGKVGKTFFFKIYSNWNTLKEKPSQLKVLGKRSREMLCLRLFCCATIVWLWKHKGGDVGNFISQIVLQCFARLDGEGKHVSIILTANIPEIVLQATLPISRACANVWFPYSPSWTPLFGEKLEEL